ncbi:MAG: superoxide dismutase [Ni] [Planctomycetota bacterium]
MIRTTLLLAALPFLAAPRSAPAPAAPAAPVHCQVPCGIYGDRMRIDMLMEDAATIEKGMAMITQLEQEGAGSANQMVRWVMNKDEHAQAIQETVASYWLAQRIKAPKEATEEAMAKYHKQLTLMHGITVAAMKCKQTVAKEHVEQMRKLAIEFSATYFTAEDLQHIRSHHDDDHR